MTNNNNNNYIIATIITYALSKIENERKSEEVNSHYENIRYYDCPFTYNYKKYYDKLGGVPSRLDSSMLERVAFEYAKKSKVRQSVICIICTLR